MPESGMLAKIARRNREILSQYADGQKGYETYELSEADVIKGGTKENMITVMVDSQGFVYIKNKSKGHPQYLPVHSSALNPTFYEILNKNSVIYDEKE